MGANGTRRWRTKDGRKKKQNKGDDCPSASHDCLRPVMTPSSELLNNSGQTAKLSQSKNIISDYGCITLQVISRPHNIEY